MKSGQSEQIAGIEAQLMHLRNYAIVGEYALATHQSLRHDMRTHRDAPACVYAHLIEQYQAKVERLQEIVESDMAEQIRMYQRQGVL